MKNSKVMKCKYFGVLAAVLALLMTVGCNKKAEAPKSTDPLAPQMTVSAFDTTTVQQLTNDFLNMVKEGQFDEAMSRLYVLDGDEVKPLPDEQKPECYFWLSMYKVYDYHITEYTFFKETDSEVKYELVIEDPATKEDPARINGMIRPVRRNGAWYITLANTKTETQKSQIDSLRQVKRQM